MSVVEVFFKGVIFIRVNDYIIVLDEDVFIFKKKLFINICELFVILWFFDID